MHVLILGARAPACLEWARAFHASGWRVTAADSLNWPLTRSSCAIHSYLKLPEPRSNPALWIETLRRLIEERGIDLILPTCEEVFYLSHGIRQLAPLCRVMTSDFSTMHRLHHKYQFAEMTASWSITAPETWLLESDDAVLALPTTPNELVFKPVYSRFASRTLLRPKREALNKIHPTPAQPWVAQRYVAGREHCSFSLLVEGRLTAHACYHPRYRVGSGSGIYFEPSDPPEIRKFLEEFGNACGYTGQVGFDFIETPDGHFRVLECNPRATSGVHLFDDRPQALVAALLGEGQNGLLLATPAPRMVALAMLLFAAPTHVSERAFWRDFKGARDVVVRQGDFKPLSAQIPGVLEIVGRALVRRRGLLAAATADIEWDGQSLETNPK
jgi:glutathione synthase/RimK-type ligase-like ATP-grasp enzyme